MSVPVIDIAQMRQWELESWANGKDEHKVIEQVGGIVASRALQLTHPGDSILVLAGKGHNGDDARCAIPHLNSRKVLSVNITNPEQQRDELAAALDPKPDLIIDGLFGIGLNRPLASEWTDIIDLVNRSQASVLAVDVPSGLNADTGHPLGAAVRASATLTLGAPKAGLLRQPAWPYVGRLEVAPDIGLVPCPLTSSIQWTLASDFAGYPPRRPATGHKGTFGHLGIVAGSLGYHGSAVLASRGAQRAQPGLITVFVCESAYLPVASQLQAAMVQPWAPGSPRPATLTALLYGPGLAAPDDAAELAEELARIWLASPLPVVVDASALEWIPEGATPQGAIRAITPHPGEAARMLKSATAEVQADRPRAVRDLSQRFGGCWVVLKGFETLVGRVGGPIHVNCSGNPGLAQGGSGDLLAGLLGGLLAQPAIQADPAMALRYGVWQHGAAADLLETLKPNWTIEELAELLGGGGAGLTRPWQIGK